MKNSIYSRAFQIAHQVKSFFNSFSEALKVGWMLAKLFLGRAVTFSFAKKNTAEVRTANAIALGSLETIKKGYFRFVETIESGTQWRSAKIERLIFN